LGFELLGDPLTKFAQLILIKFLAHKNLSSRQSADLN